MLFLTAIAGHPRPHEVMGSGAFGWHSVCVHLSGGCDPEEVGPG